MFKEGFEKVAGKGTEFLRSQRLSKLTEKGRDARSEMARFIRLGRGLTKNSPKSKTEISFGHGHYDKGATLTVEKGKLTKVAKGV